MIQTATEASEYAWQLGQLKFIICFRKSTKSTFVIQTVVLCKLCYNCKIMVVC